MLKPMTHKIRKKISEYRKTKVDIAELVNNVDIRNEDLSRCYISRLDVFDQNISGCDFTGTTMMLNAKNAKAMNCKFIRCKLLQGSSLRGCDLRRSNLYEADCGFIDYAYADLRGANICGVNFSFASRLGHKAKVSENILELLKKWWEVVPGEPMKYERTEE